MSNIKERPILFNGDMVRAILDGRKTVTRREVKKRPALDCLAAGFEPAFLTLPGNADLCPYGQAGERLWVRETWARVGNTEPGYLTYKATYPACLPPDLENVPINLRDIGERWCPSIHMFRKDSRILLEITNVRVERLQNISDAEIEREGIDLDALADGQDRYDMCHAGSGADGRPTLQSAWRHLWESTGGDWDANPWVWVIEFKKVTPCQQN